MQPKKHEIIFETIVGSQLYGTNVEESDIDYKGVCILDREREYFSFTPRFEQFHSNEIDREIYDFRKFLGMLAQNNPNIMDLVFSPEKYWVQTSPTWEMLIKHKDKFISQKCKHTFLGYATSQLKRIKSHKKWLMEPLERQPLREDFGIKNGQPIVREDLMKAVESIPIEYFREGLRKDFTREKQYQGALREWNHYRAWKKNRNPKRAKMEAEFGFDLKHSMHLIRLSRMGREILRDGKVNVDRRGIDADDLLDIRKGLWSYDKVVNEAESIENEIKEMKSDLPEMVDKDFASELCIEVIKTHLSK